MKRITALVLTVLALLTVAHAGVGGPPDAVAVDATAHIGAYLGGSKYGNAGAAIGGAVGALTGLAVGAYAGSSMGPAGTLYWGASAASWGRSIGTIVGGA